MHDRWKVAGYLVRSQAYRRSSLPEVLCTRFESPCCRVDSSPEAIDAASFIHSTLGRLCTSWILPHRKLLHLQFFYYVSETPQDAVQRTVVWSFYLVAAEWQNNLANCSSLEAAPLWRNSVPDGYENPIWYTIDSPFKVSAFIFSPIVRLYEKQMTSGDASQWCLVTWASAHVSAVWPLSSTAMWQLYCHASPHRNYHEQNLILPLFCNFKWGLTGNEQIN